MQPHDSQLADDSLAEENCTFACAEIDCFDYENCGTSAVSDATYFLWVGAGCGADVGSGSVGVVGVWKGCYS